MVFDDDSGVDESYPHPQFKTPQEIAGYLALKHANGASFSQVLEWHRVILLQIGYRHVATWGPLDGAPTSHDRDVKDGAYYVLSHLEYDDEWGYQPLHEQIENS
jgi:hypothetical protein